MYVYKSEILTVGTKWFSDKVWWRETMKKSL